MEQQIIMKSDETKQKSRQHVHTTLMRGMFNLKEVPLFAALSAEQLLLIADIAIWDTYQINDVICHEGEEGNYFYIIVSGTVETLRKGKHMAELGIGDFIGETECMEQGIIPLTAYARSDVLLIRIMRDDLQGLIELYPVIAKNLIDVLVKRIRTESMSSE